MTTYTATANTDGWELTASNTNGTTTYTLKDPSGSVIYSGPNPTGSISKDSSLTKQNQALFAPDGIQNFTGLTINGQKNYYVASNDKVNTLLAGLSQMVSATNADIKTQQTTVPASAAVTAAEDQLYDQKLSVPPPIPAAVTAAEEQLDGKRLSVPPPVPAAVAAAEEQLDGKRLSVPPATDDPSKKLPMGNDIQDIYDPNLTPEQVASLSPGDQKARADELGYAYTGPPVTAGEIDAATGDIVVTANTGDEFDAESQATEQDQANFDAKADWRVRLSLAPDSKYLYNDPNNAGILKPLIETDGVVFPYTPAISVNYAANYETTNIVHSNYKIFQYSGSAVDQVTITCTFTAQDTFEANYLLAVIHFFRTMTKMFYGQDENPKNGTPPPLCYMFGMGGYQFAAHPLAIQGFSYNLPDDVDYIRTTTASPAGTPKPTSYSPTDGRLAGAGVQKGGKAPPPTFTNTVPNEAVTWVPTRIQMSITCVPIVSRNAISNRFSLRDYASGKLVLGTREPGGGMW